MRIAQNLYEGVRLEGEGTVGLITYLRTDSTRISQEADAAAREYIGEAYGKNYVGRPESAPKAGEHIQDAHEAIRPSSIRRTPQSVRNDLGRDEYRLYKLIWERFAASRMADYEYDSTRVTVSADGFDFRATAAVPAFDGFRLVYSADEEKAKKDKVLKGISKEDRLSDPVFEPKQHFTQPLPHYTEASLVQAMEACGIGRPSTYAPTIATLSDRHYILKEGRNLTRILRRRWKRNWTRSPKAIPNGRKFSGASVRLSWIRSKRRPRTLNASRWRTKRPTKSASSADGRW